MGAIITHMSEANRVVRGSAAAAATAIHAKMNYIPARAGFTKLSTKEVEKERRKAYDYAL